VDKPGKYDMKHVWILLVVAVLAGVSTWYLFFKSEFMK
jgi:hypothetical protein